jgi:hypothetical protein
MTLTSKSTKSISRGKGRASSIITPQTAETSAQQSQNAAIAETSANILSPPDISDTPNNNSTEQTLTENNNPLFTQIQPEQSNHSTPSDHNNIMDIDTESHIDTTESLEVLVQQAQNNLKQIRDENEHITTQLLVILNKISSNPNNQTLENDYQSLL